MPRRSVGRRDDVRGARRRRPGVGAPPVRILSAIDRVDETPVDRWLAEQADLSAVERFARHHDETGHRQARHYRDLLPLSSPGAGEQYAFEVDLDACTGCKACV